MPILEAIVVEVEATLNDRPLTYVSADVTDVEPLTPAQLLYGRRMVSLPHSNIEDPEDPESFRLYCFRCTDEETTYQPC